MKAPVEARNHQLDGLRGYAALAVVFFHSIFFDPTMAGRVLGRDFSELKDWYDLLAKLLLIIFNGQTAVVIFFILSGAVLFESLRQREKGSISSVVGKFLIRRFFRIYPALVVCLLTCWVAFYFLTTTRSVEQLLQNIVLFDFSREWPDLDVERRGSRRAIFDRCLRSLSSLWRGWCDCRRVRLRCPILAAIQRASYHV